MTPERYLQRGNTIAAQRAEQDRLRAEFLRARNFEYVRAAKAMGGGSD